MDIANIENIDKWLLTIPFITFWASVIISPTHVFHGALKDGDCAYT